MPYASAASEFKSRHRPCCFYIPDALGVFGSLKDDCQLADLKQGAVPDPAIHKLVA